MGFQLNEMAETIRMVQMENLDIRTVTMGINLRDCADSDFEKMNQNVSILSNYTHNSSFLTHR